MMDSSIPVAARARVYDPDGLVNVPLFTKVQATPAFGRIFLANGALPSMACPRPAYSSPFSSRIFT